MTKISEPIVFFGNERLATGITTTAPTLQRLLTAGYKVAAVVANYEESISRNKRVLEIAEVAHTHGVPLYLPKKVTDIHDILLATGAKAAVLVAYGRMVPQSIIDLFPKGIVNIHPSLLPLHRGPTPLESIILDGSIKTGVSLMKLVKAMDAGPVYSQKEVDVQPGITKQALADQLLDIGGAMVIEHLPAILSGTLEPVEQEAGKATYDALIGRDQGVLDWSKPAIQLEREIRAFYEWPKSRAQLGAVDCIITRAHTLDTTSDTPGSFVMLDKKLAVRCGEGTLVIDSLKPAGKQEMTSEAFLAGYRKVLGL